MAASAGADGLTRRHITGELLADAGKLVRNNATMLAPQERAFVEASIAEDQRRRMKTYRRAALAMVAVLMMVLVPTFGWQRIRNTGATIWAMPRLWGGNPVLPVSASAKANLRQSIENIAGLVRQDADEHPEFGPWSMAQMRASLQGLPANSPNAGRDLRDYMTALREPACQCWRETAERLPSHFATAWVLLSFALYGERATPEELAGVLQRQSKSGWWGIYHLMDTDRNASAGVTALTLYALQQHIDRGLIAPDQEGAAKEAVAKGIAWLLGQVHAGAGRWPPYPPPPIGIFEKGEYPGLSAFVLHILHSVIGQRDFDRAWLDNLPIAIPHFRDNEIPKANLLAQVGAFVEVDDSRFYRFPWMLLVTVDSQSAGSLYQRARALVWVEEALRAPFTTSDFGSEAWIAGEVLFALRQAEAKLDGKPSFAESRPNTAASSADADRYKNLLPDR